MDKLFDDYYYRLGRQQAVIEQNKLITKSQPIGATARQKRDWLHGYNDMLTVLEWRRAPIKVGKVS